jgi:hypothetical protein
MVRWDGKILLRGDPKSKRRDRENRSSKVDNCLERFEDGRSVKLPTFISGPMITPSFTRLSPASSDLDSD